MGRWQGQPIARAIRAARSLSRSRVWLVPENTSMSPDFALRTCTTMGPAGACRFPPADAAGRVLAADRVAAEAAGLRAPPRAVAASPTAPAVAAPWSTERRETR